MIHVYLYIKQEEQARRLAAELLKEQLVAHVSIDFNNHVYSAFNGELKENITCLLTAQTKALLFDQLVSFVNERLPEEVKIYSTPITQCNSHFSELIRTRTKAV